MSTIFYTKPEIKYNDFLKTKSVEIHTPIRNFYTIPHKIVHKNGHNIFVYSENDIAIFERYGINDVRKIFPNLIEEFNVEFFNEYGLKFPDNW